MLFIFFLIVSYMIASIPFGFVIAKCKGIDLRLSGSGNIGATNAHRVGGKLMGITTLILDGLKGFIPVLVAGRVFGDGIEQYFVALACVLGHVFPIYLKFKGGKGVATTLFVVFALDCYIASAMLLIWVTAFFMSRTSSIASIAGALSFPFLVLFFSGKLAFICLSVILSVIIILRHRENIKRIMNGEEFSFKRK